MKKEQGKGTFFFVYLRLAESDNYRFSSSFCDSLFFDFAGNGLRRFHGSNTS